jgi:hypothetical protein
MQRIGNAIMFESKADIKECVGNHVGKLILSNQVGRDGVTIFIYKITHKDLFGYIIHDNNIKHHVLYKVLSMHELSQEMEKLYS